MFLNHKELEKVQHNIIWGCYEKNSISTNTHSDHSCSDYNRRLVCWKTQPSSFNNSDQNSLFIASFSPEIYGNNVTGGNIILVNPTSRYFDNLTLTAKVDDSKLIVPSLRLWLPTNDKLNASIPQTRIIIEPYQNETIHLDLAGLHSDI